MKQVSADENEKRRILELLKNYAENAGDEEDEEEEDDFVKRFRDVDLDNANTEDILSLLNADEMEGFKEYIKGESWAAEGIGSTEPWWLQESSTETIRMPYHSSIPTTPTLTIPKICNPIPLLTEITRRQPDPSLIFSVGDLILTYVVLWRHLDGEITGGDGTRAELFSALAWQTSRTLSDRQPFTYIDVIEAMETCIGMIHHIKEGAILLTTEVGTLYEDAARILATREWVQAALSDMYRAFLEFSEGRDRPREESKKAMRKRAGLTSKKVWFFLALVSDEESGAVPLELMRKSIMAAARGSGDEKREADVKKPVIMELKSE
ncbi:hypothetical protein HDU67_000788 [Dinochytrium kinnereticum]|nr:hypothetical protein HDU67_000788 [Dinochytrium kinnereticum]